MKKLIIGIISITLLMSMVVFGDEVVELFNLITLGDKAVENSLSLDSTALTLENKKLDLDEVNEDAIKVDHMQGDRVTFINNRIKVEVDTLVAEMAVWKAETALEKASVDLENDIYKKGLNYLLLLDNITLNEQLLTNQNIYLSNLEKKVSGGVSTTTDLTNQKIAVQSQEMKIIELQASLEAAKIELNHLVGNNLDAELNLEDNITLMNFVTYDGKQAYADRYEKYPDIYEKTILLEAKTIEFDLYADKYLETNKEYKTALYNKQIAEINLADAKKNYEVSLRQAYNKLLNALDSYKLSVKQLELQNKLYEDTNLKYTLGLVNSEEVLLAEEAKLNAEYAVTSAIVNFNTARIDFVFSY